MVVGLLLVGFVYLFVDFVYLFVVRVSIGVGVGCVVHLARASYVISTAGRSRREACGSRFR